MCLDASRVWIEEMTKSVKSLEHKKTFCSLLRPKILIFCNFWHTNFKEEYHVLTSPTKEERNM
jgi:hypothetical protein